jgi:hypothetical protein
MEEHDEADGHRAHGIETGNRVLVERFAQNRLAAGERRALT